MKPHRYPFSCPACRRRHWEQEPNSTSCALYILWRTFPDSRVDVEILAEKRVYGRWSENSKSKEDES